MASAKAALGDLFGKIFFKQTSVVDTELIGASFKRIVLSGDALRGVTWSAGDKVQLFLGDPGMRTYTPMRWKPDEGTVEILAYLHGDTPGVRWARALAKGDRVQVFGPRSSLAGRKEHAIVFGDETSFALALSLQQQVGAERLQCVFEASDPKEAQTVLQQLGVSAKVEPKNTVDALARALTAALSAQPEAALLMSGNALSIQAVRKSLKAAGVSAKPAVKAYWAPGKVGLD